MQRAAAGPLVASAAAAGQAGRQQEGREASQVVYFRAFREAPCLAKPATRSPPGSARLKPEVLEPTDSAAAVSVTSMSCASQEFSAALYDTPTRCATNYFTHACACP